MSADNRSVSTDALETLGTIITEKEKRDAIHLAVIPIVAGENLSPGADVGIYGDGKAYKKCLTMVGIVDPFLKDVVLAGQYFWLVVYPRQITSLRHVWTHPQIPDMEIIREEPSEKTKSEVWIRDYIARADAPSYETLLAAAINNDEEEYLHISDEDAHGEIPSELWHHIETVTGRKGLTKAKYFSCSC